MEPNGSVLTSTVFLDGVGEVVLRLDPDGLSWEPVESMELSKSCLDFKFNSVIEKEVKFSDIYAAEDTNYGLIHRPTKRSGGLLSEGHSEMHEFVVHGSRRSRSRQSFWTLAAYTFGHKDLLVCQMWVDLINSYIYKDVERPRSLLVFVNPLSGRRTGIKTWEDVRPLFSRSKVKTKVVVTERAGHAYDYMKSITNSELKFFDGILAVGGDGFFNEVLNGLLSSRHKAPCPPTHEEAMLLVENDKNASINNFSDVEEYAKDVQSELPGNEKEPLLAGSEYIAPNFTDSITDSGEDSTILFPNNRFRLGLIPAGSTDSIVLSTTGARDPITSALHVVLGKRIRLDIARVISWKGEKQSRYAHCVRYAASFAGYGFYGDVITESEKYRWMGPNRYDYAGTKVFLRHRSYEADVAYLECIRPSINSGRVSEDTSIHPKKSSRNLHGKVCRVNCVTCNQSTDTCDTVAVSQDTCAGLPPRNSRWVSSKGRFQSVGAAIISCRNERAPDGLVADAHLADGFMHLILIKECPRPLYLWHLIQLKRNGSDPQSFEFVEHHKTQAFTFKTNTDESVWNLDGEILQARHLSAQVFRGLVGLFAAGPEY